MFTYFADRPKDCQKKDGNYNPHNKSCVRLVGEVKCLDGSAGCENPAIPDSYHSYADPNGCGKKYPFDHSNKECSRYV